MPTQEARPEAITRRMDLKSLARQLGLSPTTVSRALNGYPEVSERTRARVVAAAKAAGYSPNPTARSLAVGRADAVGMIYPLTPNDLGDPHLLNVVAGMTRALDRAGMDLLIASAFAADELRTYTRMIRGRRVDGLVVARTQVHDARLEYLMQEQFPFVAYGRSRLSRPYTWFDFDNTAGGRLAVDRLISLGHRRIALIGASRRFSFALQRYEGFVAGMDAAGVGVEPDLLLETSLDRRGGYQATRQLLTRSPRPSAIVVDNHLAGVGVIRALLDKRIAIGSEISVVVYDGLPEDTLVGLQATTIAQPTDEQTGQHLVDLLLAQLRGEPVEGLHVLRQPELVIGETDGPCQD